jgi:hypothetical protein
MPHVLPIFIELGIALSAERAAYLEAHNVPIQADLKSALPLSSQKEVL